MDANNQTDKTIFMFMCTISIFDFRFTPYYRYQTFKIYLNFNYVSVFRKFRCLMVPAMKFIKKKINQSFFINCAYIQDRKQSLKLGNKYILLYVLMSQKLLC